MTMVKSLFVLMTLTLGTRALAQETCEAEELEKLPASVVYSDLDHSGKLDEIVLWSNYDREVTIDVAFDVPEKRGDEYSSDLGLEIKDLDGDGDDDLSLVVEGESAGLVEVDWAALGKDSCGKEDYESDVQVIYRQFGVGEYTGTRVFQMGIVFCAYRCVQRTYDGWERVCIAEGWVCEGGDK